MATKFVETTLPVDCSWCKQRLHLLLGVENLLGDTAISLVLCPRCDAQTLEMVRERVVGFGRLEQRGDVLVWVADRKARPESRDQEARGTLPKGFIHRAGKRKHQ